MSPEEANYFAQSIKDNGNRCIRFIQPIDLDATSITPQEFIEILKAPNATQVSCNLVRTKTGRYYAGLRDELGNIKWYKTTISPDELIYTYPIAKGVCKQKESNDNPLMRAANKEIGQ